MCVGFIEPIKGRIQELTREETLQGKKPTHKSLEQTKGAINEPTVTWSLAQLPIA